MNLGTTFLNHIQNNAVKPNIVVVFSPPGRFFTTVESNKPASTTNYNGSQSYIFWKHEPDNILSSTEAIFDNHLQARIGENVPLNCIDSVNVIGSEIDLKDASVQDDNVEINVVLDDVSNKSFFHDLIGRNVEIFFGFRDDGYSFEDYERFYVGELRAIKSNSTLSLTLTIGNICDYWNKTWRHSKGIKATKLAYDYPLNESFQKEGDEDVAGTDSASVFMRPEWALRQIGIDHEPWGFSYAYFGAPNTNDSRFFVSSSFALQDQYAFKARPEYELNKRVPKFDPVVGQVSNIGFEHERLFIRKYEPFYPTSMFIFQPSGDIDHIATTAPELYVARNIYPDVDAGFLSARQLPAINNRIRFKVDTTIVESNYIDSVAVFPFWTVLNLFSTGVDFVTGVKNLVNYVERIPDGGTTLNSPTIQQLRNRYNVLTAGDRPKFFTVSQHESFDHATERRSGVPNLDGYNLRSIVSVYGSGPIPRFNYATKLKLFVDPKYEKVDFVTYVQGGNAVSVHYKPNPPDFSAGDDVQFFDLDNGIGSIDNILINTLNQNLGISTSAINRASFAQAIDNLRVGFNAPKDSDGNFLNSDYAFSGGEDSVKEHIETKILKSNNLRIISDGGVLRCIFLGLNNLREKQNGDDPFVLSEDDIIEPTVYETRHQDYISRLKIRVGFNDLESDTGAVTYYAHDNRSPDRTQGSIIVYDRIPTVINERDHEEVDLYINYTESNPRIDPNPDKHGMVGNLFKTDGTHNYRQWVTAFAQDYFNVVNPFIRLTVIASHRALAIEAGEIIVLRDHKAVELFGSQFIKVLITNKSINNWGTDAIQVTLDCLFVERSLDFLESGDVDAPSNLRLESKSRSVNNPYTITEAVVKWDAPDDWGQTEQPELYSYEVVESGPFGERVLFKLSAANDSAEDGRYDWDASDRELRMFLTNPTTYHIFVRADNGVRKSPDSNVLTIETFETSSKPSKPLNLVGRPVDRTAVLNWSPPASNGGEDFTSYNLYVNGELFLNLGSSTNYTYSVDGTAAESIQFYVTAQNSRGESEPSNTVTVNFQELPPVPAGSIQLSAVTVDESRINLFWDATITQGSGGLTFNVHRSDNVNSVGPIIGTVGASERSYRDTRLQKDTEYCYTVIANNPSGEGVNSNRVCVRTLGPTFFNRPGPVTNLHETGVTKNQLTIAWSAPVDDGGKPITHYKVCNSNDNANFVCINRGQLNRLFTSLNPGTTYFFTVAAINEIGEGPPEEIIVTTTPNVTQVPTVPTIAAEQSDDLETLVTVDVPNYVDEEVTSVTIEKSTDNSTFTSFAVVTNLTSQTVRRNDAGLVDGTTYYYRAKATNAVGDSVYTDVVSVTIEDCGSRNAVISNLNIRFKDANATQRKTSSWVLFDRTTDVDGEGTDDRCGAYEIGEPGLVSKPRNLRLELSTDKEADIAWEPPLYFGGYQIAYYRVVVSSASTRQEVTSATTETTLFNLTQSTRYTVLVSAVNAGGVEGPQASLSFSTQAGMVAPQNVPGAPTRLRILSSQSDTDKTFAWRAPANLGNPPLTSYQLDIGGTVVNTSATTYREQNLLHATNYTVRVRARNTQGFGPWSQAFNFSTESGLPSEPTNFKLTLEDQVNVKLEWEPPTLPRGIITGYTIYYREVVAGASWVSVDVGNVETYTVENLSLGKTYEFNLSAENITGEGTLTETKQIAIPANPKIHGSVTLHCRYVNGEINLLFTPDEQPSGFSNVSRGNINITIPGRVSSKNYNFEYKGGSLGEVLLIGNQIKSLFSITTLPSGIYHFSASARNEDNASYSVAVSRSRCSLPYTTIADRAKPVSNIQFSKESNRLNITFVEPTHNGDYTFYLNLSARDNDSGALLISRTGTTTKNNPNGSTQTISIELTDSQFAEIFDNKTIVAIIRSFRTGSIQVARASKTQVYADVVMLPNAPNVDSISIGDNNIPYIQFDYPSGANSVDGFRVYANLGENRSRLEATIPNTYADTDTNIIAKVGTKTYTTPGDYPFFMVSYNEDGESQRSNEVILTIPGEVPASEGDPEFNIVRLEARPRNGFYAHYTERAGYSEHRLDEVADGLFCRVFLVKNSNSNYERDVLFYPFGDVKIGQDTGAMIIQDRPAAIASLNVFDFSRRVMIPDINHMTLSPIFDYRLEFYSYNSAPQKRRFRQTNMLLKSPGGQNSYWGSAEGPTSPIDTSNEFSGRLPSDLLMYSRRGKRLFFGFKAHSSIIGGFKIDLFKNVANVRIDIGSVYVYAYDRFTTEPRFQILNDRWNVPTSEILETLDSRVALRAAITYFNDRGSILITPNIRVYERTV